MAERLTRSIVPQKIIALWKKQIRLFSRNRTKYDNLDTAYTLLNMMKRLLDESLLVCLRMLGMAARRLGKLAPDWRPELNTISLDGKKLITRTEKESSIIDDIMYFKLKGANSTTAPKASPKLFTHILRYIERARRQGKTTHPDVLTVLMIKTCYTMYDLVDLLDELAMTAAMNTKVARVNMVAEVKGPYMGKNHNRIRDYIEDAILTINAVAEEVTVDPDVMLDE